LTFAAAIVREVTADPGKTGDSAMIKGIPIVSVWVLDQEAAKRFYVEKLGCTVTNDVALENGRCWLTVRPGGSSGQELLLMDAAHSIVDADTAEQVRVLVAMGALSPGVMAPATAVATMLC
jgi:catechol 2,3-dioxygenase-like lactoylglutathione lyase family enzyme